MIIVFGGHLDRAFRLGTHRQRFRQPYDDGSEIKHKAEEDPYRSFFHRAGMMFLLSDAQIDHTSLPLDLPVPRPRRRPNGATYMAIPLRKLEDDGQFFAEMLTQIDAFSDETLAALRLRAHDDPHKPNAIHQVDDILMSILHAWMTGSTLVLSMGEGQALAEIATCILDVGIPVPFGIPDLRGLSRLDPRSSGMVANLQPSDCGDLNDLRETPAICLYRSRLRLLAERRTTDYTAGLASALREASMLDHRLREAPADIRLTVLRVPVIDNAHRDDIINDPLGWSRRRAPKRRLQVMLLSDSRSLC
ncbi:hypothetical protein MCBMB27_00939 [Methylobacterium phyllosphaerae]|uniref:Uncharacterized protein n=2 Tax=Methylobacterium TaxID=407 RepID=A0AAE8L5G6_9HYPH|nr:MULTISPECIES: hypothetical protein [Methylobacterium]AIQ89360.1 protein of unassigned function [Methylobacterium oryzae CBMB20]APT30230.1 hypothetical protein MCBMB27_00939 [Methylobacterium phyllosphaerae]SFG53353.1 hypothetical protein SAMN05192567_104221 [Methylobacterium phyllosphaerae]